MNLKATLAEVRTGENFLKFGRKKTHRQMDVVLSGEPGAGGRPGLGSLGEPVYLPVMLALGCVCATAVLWRALRGGRPVDRLNEKVVCALCECTSACGAAGLRPCGAAADLFPPLISARLVLLCQAFSFLAL